MHNGLIAMSLVSAGVLGALVGGAIQSSNIQSSNIQSSNIQSSNTPERVFAPSFTYANLAEAREASTHYYCTDIIGVPDGYRLEVLPNENC